jgi:PAS domain S-box-containing protein
MAIDALASGWAKAVGVDRKQFNMFFDEMLDGFAYHRIVVDKAGQPIDYVFLEVNHAFEKMTGLKREKIVGKQVTEVLVGIEKDPADWIGVYGKVALTGKPVQFENYNEALCKWFKVVAYCPEKGYFVALFEDITEHKKAEEALKLSEAHYRTLFSGIGEGFELMELLFDENNAVYDLRYLEVNDTYEKQTGLKAKDVVGKTVKELFPKIEGMWIEVFEKVIKTGMPTRLEDYHQDTNRYYSAYYFPLGKKEVGVLFRDITERKKVEDELILSEKRYRELFNSMAEMFQVVELIFDKDGKAVDFYYRDVNPALERFAGKTREQLVGKSSKEVFGSVESYWLEIWAKVAKTGEPSHYENYGAAINKYYETFAWKAEENKVAVIISDITERKQAEEKLEDYRNNLEKLVEERTKQLELNSAYARSLLEASLDPLVTINKEGKITDVNKATEDVTGCSREEMIGSDFSNYFTKPDEAREGYKKVFTNSIVKDYPLAIKHKCGKITQVLYNATVYTNDSGEIQGVFAAARDVTELNKAEAEAQEAAKKLKDSERLAAIGATAGMVGHDIRNPLQAITSDLYLAKTELASLPENGQKANAIESLTEIEHNIDYINKIVADLQDYARPLNPRAQETNIKTVFNEVLSKNGIPKNIKVSMEVDENAEKIMADPDYLKRIAANLTLNAVQAMADGGKLTIHAYVDKATEDVLIAVKDTGVGIPEDIKSKLFTPMMTTKSKGQGFGLAVVKRMTEGLGGTVTFESTEGKGTTFTVRLPPPKS